MDFDCGRRTWIFIDYNFEKSSFYNLRVFGYSRGGVGKMSSPLVKFSIGKNFYNKLFVKLLFVYILVYAVLNKALVN